MKKQSCKNYEISIYDVKIENKEIKVQGKRKMF